jgi:ComF family protein
LVVIPVPLHRRKQAQRGFNQARALAVQALASLRKSHPDWRLNLDTGALVRVRATESQADLTPRQRRLNVRAAFRVADKAQVAGKNVLVIDDIMTTGATARAAALAIRRAGAAAVWVATLARARREGYAANAGAGVAADWEEMSPGMTQAGNRNAQRISTGWFS